VSAAEAAAPVSAAEAKALFASLLRFPALVLAVSGGPDSTALLLLVARWRLRLKVAPKLLAVTVDHGLRRASAGEARAVKALARRLGIDHRTLRWTGKRPASGLQQAAREARYRLLGQAANSARAGAIVTAHTLDDQAETVLMRMSRGSGIGDWAPWRANRLCPGADGGSCWCGLSCRFRRRGSSRRLHAPRSDLPTMHQTSIPALPERACAR